MPDSAGLLFVVALALRATPATLPASSFAHRPESAPSMAQVPVASPEWTVEITTSGGFTGHGRGGMHVSSSGELVCTPGIAPSAPCPPTLAPRRLRDIDELVERVVPQATEPVVEVGVTPRTICNDCISIVLTVRRRLADGREVGGRWSWTEAMRSPLPIEVRHLYEAMLTASAP